MVGVELDMIVTDSLAALKLYQEIFGAEAVETVEATSYEVGGNEAVFNLYGTRFHMLDENAEYGMFAPKEGEGKPVWFNVVVEDIRKVYNRALAAGCSEVQPVVEMEAMGVMKALFFDPFGYMWMLHQIVKVVSFEERCRIMEEQMGM